MLFISENLIMQEILFGIKCLKQGGGGTQWSTLITNIRCS